MFNVPITRRRFFFADPYFAAQWPDYEGVRSAVSGGSEGAWKRLEADFCQQSHCMVSNLVTDDLKK